MSRFGVYGPYHRTGTTQDNETIRKQAQTDEIWGKPNRGSDFPSVDAWIGELDPDDYGIEFWTDVEPDRGQPPYRARWRGPREGVRVEDGWAKMRVRITKARYQP
jgi:hypothetical protein